MHSTSLLIIHRFCLLLKFLFQILFVVNSSLSQGVYRAENLYKWVKRNEIQNFGYFIWESGSFCLFKSFLIVTTHFVMT